MFSVSDGPLVLWLDVISDLAALTLSLMLILIVVWFVLKGYLRKMVTKLNTETPVTPVVCPICGGLSKKLRFGRASFIKCFDCENKTRLSEYK